LIGWSLARPISYQTSCLPSCYISINLIDITLRLSTKIHLSFFFSYLLTIFPSLGFLLLSYIRICSDLRCCHILCYSSVSLHVIILLQCTPLRP
jgi:hypothetical protein